MNNTYPYVCNASPPGALFLDIPPTLPPTYLQATAAVIYTLLSILTVGGNALVCLIVFQYMGIANVTNLFIANLAITDIFVGIFCMPIVLVSDYLLSNWPFGIFMCKFTSFAQSLFICCTVYTLIAMSVDRYIAIIYPLQPKLTRKRCYLLISALWIFSILFSSPIFLEMHLIHVCFHRDSIEHRETRCQPNGLETNIQTVYNILTLSVIYLIPLSVLTIVYVSLGCHLKQSRAPGEAHSERDAKIKKSKQKVIKMCFVVVIMFGVCWFPMQIYINILRECIHKIIDQKYVPHVYFAFHLMAMSNSCINPFIYGVMSSKFRAGYLNYWHSLLNCCCYFNDHYRPKEIRNESVTLTTSFRQMESKHKLSATNSERGCPDRASSLSVPSSLLPLMPTQKCATYD